MVYRITLTVSCLLSPYCPLICFSPFNYLANPFFHFPLCLLNFYYYYYSCDYYYWYPNFNITSLLSLYSSRFPFSPTPLLLCFYWETCSLPMDTVCYVWTVSSISPSWRDSFPYFRYVFWAGNPELNCAL